MGKDTRGHLIIGGIVVLAVVGILFATFQEFSDRRVHNAWLLDCTKHHGVVGWVHEEALSDSYECFVNGKIVTLPGWEKYSTGVTN